jgi:hypothetical protein
MQFRDAPLVTRLQFVGLAAIVYGVAIAYFTFWIVTLRKTVELSEPWDVVQAFAVTSAALAVPLALSLLHARR